MVFGCSSDFQNAGYKIVPADSDEPRLLVCPMAGRFTPGHQAADSIRLQERL